MSTSSFPPSRGGAIAETIAQLITATDQVAHILRGLSDQRRVLIIEDPRSAWHDLAEAAVRDAMARLQQAGVILPLGTRPVAQAAGLSTATVCNACDAGEIRSERSDSGEHLLDPEDARRWVESR